MQKESFLGGKVYRQENEKYMTSLKISKLLFWKTKITEMFLDSLRSRWYAFLMNSIHLIGSYRPPKIILQSDLVKMPEAITLKPLTSGVWEGQNQLQEDQNQLQGTG